MIAGHPFKGAGQTSLGNLFHPDMKRFNIADRSLFKPPRPDAFVGGAVAATAAAATYPTFSDFFRSYFGGRPYSTYEPKCQQFLQGMKSCFENNASSDPVGTCEFYIAGFEKAACNK